MAELVAGALLSSFFQVTLEKLASRDFIGHFRRGKLDERLVKTLEITLNSINQVLDDAETKQYQSAHVKNWLDDLQHEVYEADQLLDEIAASYAQPKGKVKRFFSAFTNNRFESRIEELLEKLDLLAKQMKRLGLQAKEGTCASSEGGVSWRSSNRLPTTSLVDESTTYGRDGDKEEIIKFLISDNDSGSWLPIISIVGLGGMGKTTLAQLVYNDHRMQEQFELKAWVYVSESVDVVGLTKAIMRAFQSSADGEDLNLLQHQLQQTLTGKKYLLVLDDVWSRNGESWERLLLPFRHGSSGGRIIVTTRDKEVASVMKSTQQLDLNKLEGSHCWSLFVRHAFQGKNVGDHPTLESIGKKIVDKCGGLPIAVKTMGNLLRRKFSQREWAKILETDMWRLSENDSNINPTLRLSYHNLPSNLKRCFAYCSIFPKGYLFDKDELIMLWMAEGLLKWCGTDNSEKELGNEFFDDLQSISFFQQSANRKVMNNEHYFVMHDLVHDLAKSASGEFCLRIESDRVQSIPKRTRHIRIQSPLKLKDGDIILKHICECKGLRSLMIEAQSYYDAQRSKICNKVQHDLFSRLKYLRMLSFRFCDLSELANEISNLKLLRYLDLSESGITSLPNSICTLYNLQTLILTWCPLTELPSDFHKLVNLRHLDLESTLIEKMPRHIGRLVHLQTLPIDFVVGENSGSDIKELTNLSHLQGTLCIKGLENVTDPADAAEANLKDKKHLEELRMKFDGSREFDDGSIIEREVFVLEALQPNSNLNRLTIKDYRGSSFPNWLGECCRHLPNLVSLELSGCEFCTQLPPLGQLPSLRKLSIRWCRGIEIIGEEFYSNNNSSNVPFRSLEFLEFNDMSKWEKWLCPKDFPSLKELSVRHCPKLKSSLPECLPYLQKLEISNCGELGSSIPEAANISELRLHECDNILVNESPSSLRRVLIHGTRVIESYLERILLNNAFLEELDVGDFNGANLEWSSLDLRCYNSLRTLSITEWPSPSLPFALHLFTNLHSLTLSDCPQLESFPEGGLPLSLSSLHIYKCPKLVASREEWNLVELDSLEEFEVGDDFENVESFPEENLLPPTLEFLRLCNCSKLRIINNRGLLHLKSLEYLRIANCPCLERLPEEGLPNSFYVLDIYDCPLLNQLYQKEEGERWHKIRHIPYVFIDDKQQR